jgi:glycerol uptake facilitator-like aquaporin
LVVSAGIRIVRTASFTDSTASDDVLRPRAAQPWPVSTDTTAPPDPDAAAGRAAPPPSWRLTAAHSAYEAALTTALLFCVASFVRWFIGPSAVSRAAPGIHVELLFVGLAVALLIPALILTPLGRASGGHMNPAISFGMWWLGVFPRRAVVPYTIAQLAGSLLGVVLARVVWGPPIARAPVAYAVLRPAPGWTNAALFPAEGACMATIVVLVALFLSVHELTKLVPWLSGVLVGGAITGLGAITGASLDPAREFGPAIFAGQFGFLISYLLAPIAGAALAAWLVRRSRSRRVLTHHLSGKHVETPNEARLSRHRRPAP